MDASVISGVVLPIVFIVVGVALVGACRTHHGSAPHAHDR